jgi:uncharacterized membrane protein YvbJ
MLCPSCETSLADDDKFCMNCGFDVTKITENPNQPDIKPSNQINNNTIKAEPVKARPMILLFNVLILIAVGISGLIATIGA